LIRSKRPSVDEREEKKEREEKVNDIRLKWANRREIPPRHRREWDRNWKRGRDDNQCGRRKTSRFRTENKGKRTASNATLLRVAVLKH